MRGQEIRFVYKAHEKEVQRIFTISVGRVLVLGRDQRRCDITLEGECISGRHAELVCKEEGVFVKDLGSSNGTWWGEEFLGDKAHASQEILVKGGGSLYLGGRAGAAGSLEVTILLPEKEKRVWGGAAAPKAALTEEEHSQGTIFSPRARAEAKEPSAKQAFTQEDHERDTELVPQAAAEALKRFHAERPHPGLVESVVPSLSPSRKSEETMLPPRVGHTVFAPFMGGRASGWMLEKIKRKRKRSC